MDVTVVATSAVAAMATVAGAAVGLLVGRQQRLAEDRRQRWLDAQRRRDERRQVYRTALDLITDWQWDTSYPPPGYDVVASFTKPFIRAANEVRVYGSREALLAVDRFQRAVARLNQLPVDASEQERASTDDETWASLEAFFDAARADVGPTPDDLAQSTALTTDVSPTRLPKA